MTVVAAVVGVGTSVAVSVIASTVLTRFIVVGVAFAWSPSPASCWPDSSPPALPSSAPPLQRRWHRCRLDRIRRRHYHCRHRRLGCHRSVSPLTSPAVTTAVVLVTNCARSPAHLHNARQKYTTEALLVVWWRHRPCNGTVAASCISAALGRGPEMACHRRCQLRSRSSTAQCLIVGLGRRRHRCQLCMWSSTSA